MLEDDDRVNERLVMSGEAQYKLVGYVNKYQ